MPYGHGNFPAFVPQNSTVVCILLILSSIVTASVS
jgi:hypothetical protein